MKSFFTSFLVIACLSLAITITKNQIVSPIIQANVEALSQSEIIVGTLCMECRNAARTSLGEVFLDHYPA